jgi:hypothetical protein
MNEMEVIKSLNIDGISDIVVIPRIFKEEFETCYQMDTNSGDKKYVISMWTSELKKVMHNSKTHVYLGKSKECKDIWYAIKIRNIHHQYDYLKIENEFNLLKYFNDLKNPYFPKIFDYYKCLSKPSSIQGCLIMEAYYITLYNYLKSNRTTWTWWLRVIKQLLEIFSTLEKIGISQHDTHLNNIMLITKDNIDTDPHIGLIDFDIMRSYKNEMNAKLIHDYDGYDLYTFCGSLEMFTKKSKIAFPLELLNFYKQIRKYYKCNKTYLSATKILETLGL